MANPDEELNVCGMNCPMPLIRLSQSVKNLAVDKSLRILGDDPIFEQSVKDFCEFNECEIVSISPQSGRTIEIIIKKSNMD